MELISELYGDRQRYLSIIVNFLTNAMLCTKRGGTVSIVVSIISTSKLIPSEHGYINLELNIVDTGIGISTDAIKTLFTSDIQGIK